MVRKTRTLIAVLSAIASAFRSYAIFQTGKLGVRTLPDLPREDFQNDTLVIGNMTLDYRYSSSFLDPPRTTSPDEKAGGKQSPGVPSMVIGVISPPHNRHRRSSIRETWGRGRNVHFLLGGNWSDIEEEFNTQKDLIWINSVETYKFGLTPKSMVLLHAAQKMQTSYVFKTDDDMYINFTKVENFLLDAQPSYWGKCNRGTSPFRGPNYRWGVPEEWYPREFYPDYAAGMGYALSKKTVECAVRNIESAATFNGVLMPMEDVAVGLLAESCAVPCVQTADKGQFEDRLGGRQQQPGQEHLMFHGISPQLLPLFHSNLGIKTMLSCGKPDPRAQHKLHFATACEQCVPLGSERKDFCRGVCQWSTENNTCVPKRKKPKKVSGNTSALVQKK